MGTQFELGQTVATRGALDSLGMAGVLTLVGRHHRLDPGELCRGDVRLNTLALSDGFRIFSAYVVEGVRYFVVTEATDDEGKRASTCVVESSDY